VRAVIQRVLNANVSIESDNINRPIQKGLLVFLGITHSDTEDDIDYIVQKTINLRIFEDEEGKMNRSVLDIGGDILLISQFTLYGDARKGRRPSFTEAAPPAVAVPLYEKCIEKFKETPLSIKTGVFGADMKISLINDGPVTILLDSKREF